MDTQREGEWLCYPQIKQGSANTICQGRNKIPWIINGFLMVVIICTISVIVRWSDSFAKYDCICCNMTIPDPLVPSCASGWIGYEGKCYLFSEEERNWTYGQNFCSSHGSSLARIETEPEKVFLLRYKGKADHWIGLLKDQGQAWKWADGTEFRNTVDVGGGGGDCAFLSTDIAIASRCYIPRNWICSHLDAYRKNISSKVRP